MRTEKQMLSRVNGSKRNTEFVMVTTSGTIVAAWRSGNIVGRINEVTLRQARLVLGWVTVFGRTNHLSISPSHPGQLGLLPSAGREMSTSQRAVMLCGWGVKAGMVHSTCGKTCGWQVKLC